MDSNFLSNKRGQITIFIIIAIVIVATIILFFTLTNAGKRIIYTIIPTDVDVEGDLQKCIKESNEINEKIDLIMRQGGSYEPELYYQYNNTEKLTYLCYTGNYFDGCVMQNSMLISNMENEIETQIEQEVISCFNKVKEELEIKGYRVSSSNFEIEIEIIPESIIIKSDKGMTITKGNERQEFRNFEIKKSSRAHELANIAISILNYESTVGSPETTTYMAIYPELRIIREKQGDGTTLYFLNYRNTEDKFYFASRSFVLPTGYTIA